MKDLLEFLIKGALGDQKFSVEESLEDDRENFLIHIEPASMGLLIGKDGKTIKAIRNIMKVRATLEKKGISVNIAEAENQAS